MTPSKTLKSALAILAVAIPPFASATSEAQDHQPPAASSAGGASPSASAAALVAAPKSSGMPQLTPGAVPVVEAVVNAYCSRQAAKKDSTLSTDSGPVTLYKEVLSAFTRTVDLRSAFEVGMGIPGCAQLFSAFFDRAEAFIPPSEVAQVRRSDASGNDVTCVLKDDSRSNKELDPYTCNDTIAGYEVAAVSFARGRRCETAMKQAIGQGATAPVQNAIRKYYKDVAGDDCSARPTIDCTGVSLCSGGVNDEKYGVQGILTANIGTVMGWGYGFRNDGTMSANISTYLGLRLFVAKGLLDVRFGTGLGMFPVTKESGPTGGTTTISTDLEGGALITAGVGVYHGLTSVSVARELTDSRS